MSDIGERLKSIRKELGLKQGDFARRLEMSQGMLSGIENGSEALSERNFKMICLEFGINEDWLRNGGDVSMFKRQELTSDEKELLGIYDKLTTENQKNVRVYANERLELQLFRMDEEKNEKLG